MNIEDFGIKATPDAGDYFIGVDGATGIGFRTPEDQYAKASDVISVADLSNAAAAFGQSKNDGVSNNAARSDHNHELPNIDFNQMFMDTYRKQWTPNIATGSNYSFYITLTGFTFFVCYCVGSGTSLTLPTTMDVRAASYIRQYTTSLQPQIVPTGTDKITSIPIINPSGGWATVTGFYMNF